MEEKACLRTELCKSRKLCAGEASTYDEATALCEPKGKTRTLSCDERIARAMQTMEKTRRMIQEGNVDALNTQAAKMAADIKHCTRDQNVLGLTQRLVDETKEISGQYYYVNEGKAVVRTLDALKSELQTSEARKEAGGAEPSSTTAHFLDIQTPAKKLKPLAPREPLEIAS